MLFPLQLLTTYIGGKKQLNKEPYFFSLENNDLASESLESILKLPHSIYIENSGQPDNDAVLKLLLSDAPDIALSITTASCYMCDLSHIITNALNNRFRLSGDKNLNITTCLEEAVTNAILHGNLETGANPDKAKIEHLLNANGLRRISIKAWDKSNYLKISVSDEGKGFSLPDELSSENQNNGHGFTFIRSLSDKMWLGEDRRTLYMTFNY
jgi:anti-sigma regulatory factor (Ser/Thr protein kinase)